MSFLPFQTNKADEYFAAAKTHRNQMPHKIAKIAERIDICGMHWSGNMFDTIRNKFVFVQHAAPHRRIVLSIIALWFREFRSHSIRWVVANQGIGRVGVAQQRERMVWGRWSNWRFGAECFRHTWRKDWNFKGILWDFHFGRWTFGIVANAFGWVFFLLDWHVRRCE